MLFKEFGKTTDLREIQLYNAFDPMRFKESGNTKEVKDVQLEKASL